MNLLKYFTSRDEDLPASYVRKCEKFLKKNKKIKKRVRAQARKRSSSQAWQGPGFPDSCNNLFDREVE
jgi:hypothetical protein|tara:strand:+ start:324 stop:527 length:204 start_codon:yes stop_codon:yes gene_type:complete